MGTDKAGFAALLRRDGPQCMCAIHGYVATYCWKTHMKLVEYHNQALPGRSCTASLMLCFGCALDHPSPSNAALPASE